MKITSFYGISSSANCSGAEDSDGGVTSTIKSRRLAAARAAEERIKKERDDKLRRQFETEEQRIKREKEQRERRFVVSWFTF